MARCRSCGDEIDFVPLRSGKRMPVESTTAETYYVHLGQGGHPQVVLVLDSGDIVRGRLGKQHERGGPTGGGGRQAARERRPEGGGAREPLRLVPRGGRVPEEQFVSDLPHVTAILSRVGLGPDLSGIPA